MCFRETRVDHVTVVGEGKGARETCHALWIFMCWIADSAGLRAGRLRIFVRDEDMV